jgi:hypothetical protein
VIGLYAITLRPPAAGQGARGEPLRELRLGEISLLLGAAPPALSVEALRGHESAVRRIAEACEACLPARFGASADNDEALLAALRPREEELREALQMVKGREQMTLRIHGPVAPSPAFTPTTGTRYLEERRRARRIPELDPLRQALQGMAHAERVERHSEPGLLASVYHLIDRGGAAGYKSIVESVELSGGLRPTISGPWPAWSFAPELAT